MKHIPLRLKQVRVVNTFNALSLSSSDWLTADPLVPINLKLPSRETLSPLSIPRCATHGVHPRHLVPNVSLRGFLYYYLPYPDQFLSGGLRFRCTPTRAAGFNAGYDLDDRTGLAWSISLPFILAHRKLAFLLDQLEHDGLITKGQIPAANRLLNNNPERDERESRPIFVHAIGQPFPIDLSAPVRVAVLSPYAVLRAQVCPAVATCGGAIVRLERVEDTPECDRLHLRVVVPLPDFHERFSPLYGAQRRLSNPVCDAYLPQFRHLPPLRAGDLLPDPLGNGKDPLVWEYSNDKDPVRDAALHCLLNPHSHFPAPKTAPVPSRAPALRSSNQSLFERAHRWDAFKAASGAPPPLQVEVKVRVEVGDGDGVGDGPARDVDRMQTGWRRRVGAEEAGAPALTPGAGRFGLEMPPGGGGDGRERGRGRGQGGGAWEAPEPKQPAPEPESLAGRLRARTAPAPVPALPGPDGGFGFATGTGTRQRGVDAEGAPTPRPEERESHPHATDVGAPHTKRTPEPNNEAVGVEGPSAVGVKVELWPERPPNSPRARRVR
ncbi:hypothetical protein K438DRAFT_1961370 [Mycena galopus ATCC 62051]|nr:hypothetical protein K438DRAFT_1961370 [Mycena galopus ATCC 62051]